MIVNGNDVTMYGLMVEHFLEYQTLWNGNGGRTYFYQSEIPYDVPDQASWMSHNGTVNGYASYKVADTVTSHVWIIRNNAGCNDFLCNPGSENQVYNGRHYSDGFQRDAIQRRG